MDRTDVAKMYNHLKRNYGAAFSRSFPSDTLDGWFDELRKYTPNQGMLAVTKWIAENPDRYPNLPQLLRIIRMSEENRARVVVEDGVEPGSAEWIRQREANRAVAKKFLERVKATLDGKSPYTGSSPDQNRRALEALRTPGPAGTRKAHEILTEHSRQAG